MNNVRQRQNNVVILSVEFHNVDQRSEYDHFEKLKTATKIFLSFEKKMTRLINDICCRSRLIKKKGKHGTYNVKVNVGKYNAWYMKRI